MSLATVRMVMTGVHSQITNGNRAIPAQDRNQAIASEVKLSLCSKEQS